MDQLELAWEALKTYAAGSGRAALLPIDRAVSAAADIGAQRKQLEEQLLHALASCQSVVAREYVCSKLALIGSAVSVPSLCTWLTDAELATAARSALESLPGIAATRALQKSLATVTGLQKVGVINSLAVRKDPSSVAFLTKLLRDSSPEIAAAAAAALGRIASGKAARKLLEFYSETTEATRSKLADALLVCAEGLLAAGHNEESRSLYQALSARARSPQVRSAAARGLENCGKKIANLR